MTETMAQANHELLLGVNRQLSMLSEQLKVIMSQLQDQRDSQGAPRLGLCGECVGEWLQAGSPPQAELTAALAWMATPAGYPVPVCIRHFETLLKAFQGSQLILPGR